eukprot:CAMPEP_0114159530 /NCGR_PEP_ID=MMETSP0043_2-20121206/27836_1 /TAXON_ID=464988 /ORGANISM="Hemiselmis andersenii, Strain CCMP644" /LENGTH=44 /DNA_ID= /DNA_START= /DNA_END= /DNA_ORIENTATION=
MPLFISFVTLETWRVRRNLCVCYLSSDQDMDPRLGGPTGTVLVH